MNFHSPDRTRFDADLACDAQSVVKINTSGCWIDNERFDRANRNTNTTISAPRFIPFDVLRERLNSHTRFF